MLIIKKGSLLLVYVKSIPLLETNIHWDSCRFGFKYSNADASGVANGASVSGLL